MQSRRPMQRLAWAVAALSVTAAAIVAISPAGAPAASVPAPVSTAAPCAAWSGGGQPPDPGGGSSNNNLWGVAVLSPCNAWAVGSYDPGQTIIERWDGAAWTQVPSPDPGTFNELLAVSAVSSTDIWAVGDYFNGAANQTLTAHFNGSTWTQVPSPSASGSAATVLTAVSASSATNVWAVGHFINSGDFDQTYILHWDGSSWTHVPSPHPGGTTHGQDLLGVSGTATDAWAAGSYYNGSADQSVVLHWNGTSWKQVTSPSPGPQGNLLSAVRALSASDAWAVGSSFTASGPQTLIAHWDGTSWKQVKSPSPGGPAGSELHSLAVTSANDAWAVGDYGTGTGLRTLALHWDGSAWLQSTTPNLGGSAIDDTFAAIGASAPGSAWAVGNYYNGTANQTMAVHCC